MLIIQNNELLFRHNDSTVRNNETNVSKQQNKGIDILCHVLLVASVSWMQHVLWIIKAPGRAYKTSSLVSEVFISNIPAKRSIIYLHIIYVWNTDMQMFILWTDRNRIAIICNVHWIFTLDLV